jgi:hypothetical protein
MSGASEGDCRGKANAVAGSRDQDYSHLSSPVQSELFLNPARSLFRDAVG